MLVDTSDIYAFGVAQRRHADDLAAVAAQLRSAQIAPDAFGLVGAGFLAALNAALAQEAEHAARLAEHLTAAGVTCDHAAASYAASEMRLKQAISSLQA